MNLNDLIAEAIRDHRNAGWDDGRTVGDDIALMHTELSEALEEYRNGHGITEVYYSNIPGSESFQNKPEGVGVELADVVIRIMSFCGKHDIDLLDNIIQKMAYNRTRGHRHGGKVL